MFEQLDVLTGFALAGILAAQSRHGMPTPTAAAADALDYALAVRRVLSIRKAQEHRQLAEAVCAQLEDDDEPIDIADLAAEIDPPSGNENLAT